MEEFVLKTTRTLLRKIRNTDLQLIHDFHSLAETNEFNTLGIPENLAETQRIMEQWIAENAATDIRNYTLVIEGRKGSEFMGLVGFKLGTKKYRRGELWIKIVPQMWNMGIGTEVLSEMLNFGFDQLGLHRIEAGCAIKNTGSIKMLEKIGMKREGRGRQILPLDSGWSDNFAYAILETDERKMYTPKAAK